MHFQSKSLIILSMEKELIELCKQFNIQGEFDSIEVVSNGHINSTFLIRFLEDGKIKEYILQKINKYVFKNPDEVMQNIFAVTNHIVKKLKDSGKSVDRKALIFKPTQDGNLYKTDDYGDYWRLSEFIPNSVTFNQTNNLTILEETGKAFGEFQRSLTDFSATDLNITIPHFHNTINRYDIFKETLLNDPLDRSVLASDEIQDYLSLEEYATRMYRLQKLGELKLKVTHNDTKCNNVLFDKNSHKHLCVIDLDTVMPGLLGFDYGDAIRFAANTANEDETDLLKVTIDLKKFEAFTKGFLSAIGSSITEKEKETLALGAITMTIECGLRFLTDFIDGDKYFKTDYENHNLDRARCQLKLAKEMLNHLAEMNKIVDECYHCSQKS